MSKDTHSYVVVFSVLVLGICSYYYYLQYLHSNNCLHICCCYYNVLAVVPSGHQRCDNNNNMAITVRVQIHENNGNFSSQEFRQKDMVNSTWGHSHHSMCLMFSLIEPRFLKGLRVSESSTKLSNRGA